MPRYYNGGPLQVDAIAKANALDEDHEKELARDLRKHHPFGSPARESIVSRDGRMYLKKPGMFCRHDQETGNPIPELVEWQPGSISLGLLGYGFFVVPPGGHVDLDPTVPEKAVKDAAPHLLTEAEWLTRNASAIPQPEPVKAQARKQ